MKKTIVLTLILLLLLPASALMQTTKKRGATKSRTRTAAPTPTPVDLRADAAAAAEQLKLVSRFLYLYGRISNGLETSEAQEKRGDLPRTVADRNRESKARVVENIRNLRAGLDQLLTRFQNNSKLQIQAVKLMNANQDAATAEQLAGSGRFDEAGRALVKVAERLAEVVAETR
ncbi:MAG TPA: hypothetical protein VFD58_35890 [Blastocatellia bacterium]|nr:hypothetical protein [Blastocatellia bacterium]